MAKYVIIIEDTKDAEDNPQVDVEIIYEFDHCYDDSSYLIPTQTLAEKVKCAILPQIIDMCKRATQGGTEMSDEPQPSTTCNHPGCIAKLSGLFGINTMVCLMDGCYRDHRSDAARIGHIIGQPVFVNQLWYPVLWDDEEDPDFCKASCLKEIK